MDNNFRCPETGQEFFISAHSTKFNSLGKIFVDSEGDQLVNPLNGKPLEPILRPFTGGFSIGTGKGASGQAKMQELLRKRSREDFQKNVKSRRDLMVKNFDEKGIQGL